LVGFYDPNQENADKISKEFDTNILVQLPYTCSGCNRYCNSNSFPLQMCKSCHQIRQTRFIEKPISNTIEEAEEITLANEYNVKGQVGHVERFNPAFIATKT
jgi:predicted dehydrogenase